MPLKVWKYLAFTMLITTTVSAGYGQIIIVQLHVSFKRLLK